MSEDAFCLGCAGSLYLMHGVEQLGELIETLPVLAGVLLALHDGFPQLLNVRHPNIVEHRLALQAVLWHCGRGRTKRSTIWDRDKDNMLCPRGTILHTQQTSRFELQKEERHSSHFKLSCCEGLKIANDSYTSVSTPSNI